MEPSLQIALWADRLRDISATGLRFCRSVYDRERYRSLQNLAIEMTALASDQSITALEPLRDTMFSRPTPLVGADAAVIDGGGRMLLIRRADDGCWAMPGGALEVGETPAAGAVRECLEETGVSCRATDLVGVFDSRLCGSRDLHHLYHFVFLCHPLDEPRREAEYGIEVRDQGWFTEKEVPLELSPGHGVRLRHAFRVWKGDKSFFDQ